MQDWIAILRTNGRVRVASPIAISDLHQSGHSCLLRVPAGLLRVIDGMPTTTRAVQSCFRFSQLDLPHLMHKISFSVFGHIDFFSVLKGLVISLGSSLREDWVQRSPELVQVSVFQFLDATLIWEGARGFTDDIGIIPEFLSSRPFPVVNWTSSLSLPSARNS